MLRLARAGSLGVPLSLVWRMIKFKRGQQCFVGRTRHFYPEDRAGRIYTVQHLCDALRIKKQ